MLTISAAQLAVLRKHALARFADSLAAHALVFAPRHAGSLDATMRLRSVRAALLCAMQRGYTLRGPVRLWMELTLMFGSGFNTDPQLAALHGHARPRDGSSEAQLRGAESLRELAVSIASGIAGQHGEHERRAVERASSLRIEDLAIGSNDRIVAVLRAIHPEKVALSGEHALHEVVASARRVCAGNGLDDPIGPCVISLLMFAFGHECVADPWFPWIGEIVTETQANPRMRCERLRRFALQFVAMPSRT